MFQPVEQPMSAPQAKRLFRQLLRDSGCFDKLDVQMHLESFSLELREHGRELREELAVQRSEIREKLAAIEEDAENLADAIEDARSADEVSALEEQIALTKLRSITAKRRLTEATDELDAFRLDKRQFLVDQLNQLFYGITRSFRSVAS